MYFDAKSVFHSYCLHIGMLASFSYRQKKTNKSISLVHKQSVCVLFQSMNIMQGPSLNNALTSWIPTECGFGIQGHLTFTQSSIIDHCCFV